MAESNTSGPAYDPVRRQAELEVQARSKNGLSRQEERLLQMFRSTNGPAEFSGDADGTTTFGSGGIERAQRKGWISEDK